ncbi:hypothetical protein RSJ42_03680 [Methanosarcina hadiensis]
MEIMGISEDSGRELSGYQPETGTAFMVLAVWFFVLRKKKQD